MVKNTIKKNDDSVKKYETALSELGIEETLSEETYEQLCNNPYGLYLIAVHYLNKGEYDKSFETCTEACRQGDMTAMFMMLSVFGDRISSRSMCDIFKEMFLGHPILKNGGLADMDIYPEAIKRICEQTDKYPILYTCLASFYSESENTKEFFEYVNKAICGGDPYAKYLKAEMLCRLSENKERYEAMMLMDKAVKLYSESCDYVPESKIAMGANLYCGRWIGRNEEMAKELLVEGESELAAEEKNEKWYRKTRMFWTDYFENDDFYYGSGGKRWTNIMEKPEFEVFFYVTAMNNDVRTAIPENKNQYEGYENNIFSVEALADRCRIVLKSGEPPIEFDMFGNNVGDRNQTEKWLKTTLMICINSVLKELEEID